MKYIRSHIIDIVFVLSLSVACMLVVLPFFESGFFPTHDGEWTVVRLADMYRSIRDGQFPVRFSGFLNNQYGYPLFNFAYPLPYYLGVLFVVLKLGFVGSIKMLFVGSVVSSIIGMYILARTLWRNMFAGILSAILFLFLPYRMVDLYVRGSLGEIMALAIVPWLFLFLYWMVKKQSYVFAELSGLCIALLILSHNIQSLYFVPLALGFALLLTYDLNQSSWKQLVLSVFNGIALSAFFWVPAIFEKDLILLSLIPIAERSLYYVSLSQLITPTWGYGVPTDTVNPFTYQLGIAQITSFVIVCGARVFNFIKKSHKILSTFMIGGILLMIAMTGEHSQMIWEHTPLLSEINYPWTLLAPITFLIALVAGSIAEVKYGKQIVAAIIIVSIAHTLPYAKPESRVNRGDEFYITNTATTTSSQEYTPTWVKEIPLKSPNEKIVIASGSATVTNVISRSNYFSFAVDANDTSVIRINTIYYPGWQVLINNIPQTINYANKQGVMEVSVSKGQHLIQGEFRETRLRIASNLFSLFGGVVFIGVMGYSLYKRYAKR